MDAVYKHRETYISPTTLLGSIQENLERTVGMDFPEKIPVLQVISEPHKIMSYRIELIV